MLYRLFPFTILMLVASAIFSQTPRNISFEDPQLASGVEKAFACADQNAGTIQITNFQGQSNDTQPDTIYLCEGDMIDVTHNGDFDLSGDPNPLTAPGVTYLWLACPPTVTGPDLDAVIMESCIFMGPPAPTNNFYVEGGGTANGDVNYSNLGTLQDFYNNGDPLLLFFAPITIDRFSGRQYENDPITMQSGPCVNVSVDEAFGIVFLNQIEILNINTNAGSSGCSGQAEVIGGLPEFDNSSYEVTITLQGNPSIMGTVTNNSPITHGDVINFDVPIPGIYDIQIEDGKSCGAIETANMTSCVNMTQSISSAVGAPGENICLDVTVEGGFVDIQAMQYAVTFDPSILSFTSVENISPLLPNFNQSAFSFTNDTLRVSWFQTIGGTTIPDGTVLFQICFDVIGPDGACTDVPFVEIGPITDIEIIDANGNEIGFNGIPGQVCVTNSAIQTEIIPNEVTCSGGMDGGFTITVSGGTPPYSVTWQNSLGGPIGGPSIINVDGGDLPVANLSEGIYNITITDNSNPSITSIQQVEIGGPPMLNLLFSANQGACNGDLGAVTATLIYDSVIVNNPTLNYSFLWSNMATTPTVSGLTSGNYGLTVTDNNTGCTVSGNAFLPQPAILVVTVQVDSATCTGIPDGVINVTVMGGTPDINGNYTIVLGPSSVTNSAASLMAESGDYMLTVTDANGCSYQENIFLPAIKILSITPDITNADCNGDCDGKIVAFGTTAGAGGVMPAIPYTFTWSGTPNPPPSIDLPTNSTINNLCVGTYSVIMMDTDGCQVDSTFEIIQPSPMDVTVVNVTNESCQPGMDGSITLAVAGGTYPYSYEWPAGVSSTDSIATGLTAGMYDITVRDAEGCFTDITVVVSVPTPPMIVTLDDDMIDCFSGSDGVLTVNSNPANVNVSWSNGELTPTITGLVPGEYIVTLTDLNQCTTIDTAYVTSPPPMVVDSIITASPTCVGEDDGFINIFVSGGTAPYSYSWSDPALPQAQTVLNAEAGINTVVVTDANNCQPPLIQEIDLAPPPSIVGTFSNIGEVSCPTGTGQSCDGFATVTANYSDMTAGTFNFTWIGSGEMTNNSSVSTAVQLCAGTQQVIVDDLACRDTFDVEILSPPPFQGGVSVQNVSCFGLSDGSATLSPTGGTPPYSIFWDVGVSGPTLTGMSVAGNPYTAVITDSKNCVFIQQVPVIEPDPLILILDDTETNNVSCNGGNNGTISVYPQGGTLMPATGITYLWQNNVAPINADFAENLSAGDYSVTVVDVNGCEAELTHTIIEPNPIDFLISGIPEIDCFGGYTSIAIDSAWGGTGVLRFSVDGSPPVPVAAGQPISGIVAGEHTVTVIDDKNCKESQLINISQPIEIIVDFDPSTVEIDLGDSLSVLDPIIVSSVPIDSFLWSPATQLSCTDCKNPRVNPLDDQLYTLTVIDINGCTGTGSVLVDLDRNRNVFIPNVFSPNGDGINDDFKVYTGPGVSAINFVRIYDRWGELIHEVLDPIPSPDGTAGWDGYFRGDEMNPAVFLYLIEVEFLDGQVLVYRGDIALIH